MPRGKKTCPSCDALVGVRSAECSCGHVFSHKNKKPKRISKTAIVHRLVQGPEKGRREFYMREMKLLNILCERYSLEFMNIVNFPQKPDSLAYFVSGKLKKVLDQKFNAFNFKVDNSRYEDYDLGDKFGEDAVIEPKRKSIKQLLDE